MEMDASKLAGALKPGDEITTTLGRKFMIGALHPDERDRSQYWIEPAGADDYDWWIPLEQVVAVNGVRVVGRSE